MATLKQGTALAKKIRKAHPKMSWTEAIKEAHRQLNKKSSVGYASYRLSTLKKQTKKAKAIRSKDHSVSWPVAVKRAGIGAVKTVSKSHTDKNRITVNQQFGTLAGVKSAGLTLLKDKYGKLCTKKALARTKTEKRKLTKEMAETLRAIKNIHSI